MFTISVDAIRALFILYLMFFFFFGPLFFFADTEDRRSGARPMCWYGWKRAGEICEATHLVALSREQVQPNHRYLLMCGQFGDLRKFNPILINTFVLFICFGSSRRGF